MFYLFPVIMDIHNFLINVKKKRKIDQIANFRSDDVDIIMETKA